MNAQVKPSHPVDSAFGGDDPSNADIVNYHTIATQVANMKPRALTTASFDDVVTLIEYMRDQALKMHQLNLKASEALFEREKQVTKREKELAIRQRAVEAAIRSTTVGSRWRRYFGR